MQQDDNKLNSIPIDPHTAQMGVRKLGVIIFFAGVILSYLTIYLPLNAAQTHANHIWRITHLDALAPVLLILGLSDILFPSPSLDREGKPRGYKAVSMILAVIAALATLLYVNQQLQSMDYVYDGLFLWSKQR